MSHSSYTASERRGIIVIAFLTLLLIGGGVTLSLCGRNHENIEEIPVVVNQPELVDTISLKSETKKGKKKANKSKKNKEKKTYRRRSPLDEPV